MQRVRWPKTFSVWNGSDPSINDQYSISPPVQGVYLFCAGDEQQVQLSMSHSPPTTPTSPSLPMAPQPKLALATVTSTDSIFESTPLTISELIGVPLQMRRLLAKPSTSLQFPHFDNQSATYLQIDPTTGFAPPVWARGVGTVLLVRADQEPLTKELLERIIAFHSRLLDLYDQQGKVDLQQWATPQRFREFCSLGDIFLSSAPYKGSKPGELHFRGSTAKNALGESWLDVGPQVVV